MIHLTRPWWLMLIPVGLILLYRLKDRAHPLLGWRSQMDKELLEVLTRKPEVRSVSPWMGSVSWCLMVLVLAGPVWRRVPSPLAENAAPLILLLKTDRSMTEDLSDPQPLLQAQLKIQDLVDARPDGRTALTAYAGSAHVVLPLTRDGQVIAEWARTLDPGVMPVPGDDLPAALRLAGRLLEGEPGGSVLVLADRVEAGASELGSAWRQAGEPTVQFLALLPEGDAGLTAAARAIQASVQPLTPGDADVRGLLKRADRAFARVASDEGQQWAEDAWWLLLPAALLMLFTFQREEVAV